MSEHCVHCDPLCLGNDKNPHGCGTAMWDQGECVGCRERAAIVAWLRAKAERAFLGERDPQDSLVGDIATWIERGQHLAGDDA